MILVFSKKNGNNALEIVLQPYILVFMIDSTMCSGKKKIKNLI